MKMPRHDVEDNHSNDSNNNHFTVLVFLISSQILYILSLWFSLPSLWLDIIKEERIGGTVD
jgi:hypothetical protein